MRNLMAFKNRHSAALDARAVIQKKRNADCKFFLASPFMCKKGNSCKYRHNERAKKNPINCRYWMSGNCANPKCAFRHPGNEVNIITKWGKSVPHRPMSYQANENGRVKRDKEAFTPNKRNSKCQGMNKDETSDMYFSSPKSLAELKCSKISYCGKEQSSTNGSIRSIKFTGHLVSKSSLPFEGPKSLREILERKQDLASRKINVFANGVEKDDRADKEQAKNSPLIAALEMTNTYVSCSKEECMDGADVNKELEGNVTNNLSHDDSTAPDCFDSTKYHFTSLENANALEMQDVEIIDAFEKLDINEVVCKALETEHENIMSKDEYMDNEEDYFSTWVATILAS